MVRYFGWYSQWFHMILQPEKHISFHGRRRAHMQCWNCGKLRQHDKILRDPLVVAYKHVDIFKRYVYNVDIDVDTMSARECV